MGLADQGSCPVGYLFYFASVIVGLLVGFLIGLLARRSVQPEAVRGTPVQQPPPGPPPLALPQPKPPPPVIPNVAAPPAVEPEVDIAAVARAQAASFRKKH